MTPKNKRDSLFRNSRPNIRPLEIYDGDEYHNDLKVMWVSYQKNPFEGMPEGLSQEGFAEWAVNFKRTFELIVSEDYNNSYKDGYGIIAVGKVENNGWKYEPHVQFLSWATKKNKLRTVVSFLQWIRYSRKVGCCVLHVLSQYKNLYDHVVKYGVLHYVGKIVNGDERGDVYLYSVRGKKNVILKSGVED